MFVLINLKIKFVKVYKIIKFVKFNFLFTIKYYKFISVFIN